METSFHSLNKILYLVIILSMCASFISADKVNGHLKISTYLNPLGKIQNYPAYSLGYVEAELLDLLADELNFTYEIVLPRDVIALGDFDNGSGSGCMGQLQRKEVDLVTGFGTETYSKYPYVDSSVPVLNDNLAIMMPYPKQSVSSAGLYTVFSNWVWVCVVSSFLLFSMALWKCNQYETSDGTTMSRSDALLYVLSLITKQGGSNIQKSTKYRLLLATWLLPLAVITYAYSGMLTSTMAKQPYEILANSPEDIAKNDKILTYIPEKSPVAEFLKESSLETSKIIYKRSQQYKTFLPLSTDIISLFTKENRVLIVTDTIGKAFIDQVGKKSKNCPLTLAEKPLTSRYLVVFFQKNSPLTEMFNKKLLMMQQSGIMENIINKYIPEKPRCAFDSKKTSGNTKVINLKQVWGAFIILAIGLLIGFTAFLAEKISHRLWNPKRETNIELMVSPTSQT